jgi:hypothetical protein
MTEKKGGGKLTKFALFAGTAALVFTGVAQAGNVVISDTVTGTIFRVQGYTPYGALLCYCDTAGLFGGGSLAGQLLTLTFTYDATQMAVNGGYSTDGLTYSALYDNAPYDTSGDNALTNTVATGGYTYTLPGNQQSVSAVSTWEDNEFDESSYSPWGTSVAEISLSSQNSNSSPEAWDVFNPQTPLQNLRLLAGASISYYQESLSHRTR